MRLAFGCYSFNSFIDGGDRERFRFTANFKERNAEFALSAGVGANPKAIRRRRQPPAFLRDS